MTEHTPGPWHIDPCGDILSTSVQNMDDQKDNGLICALCSDRCRDENIANARLIAAAPDMLKALERARMTLQNMEGWVASGFPVPDDSEDYEETVIAVYEAIKKAGWIEE